jgi:hypothetical protein
MLHPFFAVLNTQETALLLTTLTLGGAERVGLFAHLEPDVRQRLDDRAQALLSLADDQRVPLMVHELRAMTDLQGQQRLEFVDPSWIVHRLHGEGPRMVALVLLGMPAPQMRAVLKRLPKALRHLLPPKSELKNLPEPLVAGLRLKFLAQFDPMPDEASGPRQLRDLVHMDRGDLYRLVRTLGLIELGQAFASVEKMALAELCRRLPRQTAQELISAVQSASTVDMPDAQAAQRFLTRVVMNFEDTEEFLQRSGLWRLARGMVDEPDSFLRAMAQHLPRRSGSTLSGYVLRARELEAADPSVTARCKDGILVRAVLLARQHSPNSMWATGPIAFGDPPACEAALVEEAARASAAQKPA